MPEIGETLREARMRARIDVSEIEAKTKIRAKYLRALENEEWDLLPGPTFVRSFLRTYGDALGLDGKGLVEDYRRSVEPTNEPLEPIASTPRSAPGRSDGPSRGYIAVVGIVLVLIVLLIVGLVSKGGSSSSSSSTSASSHPSTTSRGSPPSRHPSPAPGATDRTVALSMRATGPVYVCLIGAGGRKLIAGSTLSAGTRTPTYHAKRFVLTLGNDSVTLLIDGTPRTVPASSSAIGYVITKSGRQTLAPGHLPTCA